MAKLHDMFQAAMGWTDSHLHSFEIGGQPHGMHYDEYPEGEIDEKKVTVLGSIRALTHATGATVATFNYDAHG